ncbi:hypothetical protein LOAG_02910 [Loa loa]|uniref:Uncharacterized protein n=1 Tax=Loa loa TaxID=7209 RepID=A0A1S0U7J1_LOALO|nr:hypothetical protein LOAG_02910 [Loa loa]EFO25572.1 hypothetical protein LOAG_02910 [Loa loa]
MPTQFPNHFQTDALQANTAFSQTPLPNHGTNDLSKANINKQNISQEYISKGIMINILPVNETGISSIIYVSVIKRFNCPSPSGSENLQGKQPQLQMRLAYNAYQKTQQIMYSRLNPSFIPCWIHAQVHIRRK